ncbi:MAG: hypothetical protein OXH57_01790 [Ekhidna sp.]|nr:hypothetical protein [Ekhidna sp.]
MKKFLTFIAVLLLAGAGYFTYEKWSKNSNINEWSFVPAHAAMVLELELLDDYNQFSKYPIWAVLQNTDGFKGIKQSISFLDSINGKGGFNAIFDEAPVLISTHKVAVNHFDFLYVVNLQNISQSTFAQAVIGRLQNGGYRFKTRNYRGYKIREVHEGGKAFTYTFHKNYFLASFTPYLIEDAVRTIERKQASFEEQFPKIKTQRSSGLFNLYINYSETGRLLSGMTRSEVKLPMSYGAYSVSLDSVHIDFTGFTYTQKGWLATHKNQPGSFDMAEIVPENTALMYHISSSDTSSWKERQWGYLKDIQPPFRAFQDSLKNTFDFDASQIIDFIGEEAGILTLEPGSSRESRKMCILKIKDMGEALQFFNQLTMRIARIRGDTAYTTSYSENEIRYLPIKNFPKLFLGNLADGFNECFYINYRDYLILSNNLQELKALIASIRNEDTWGKSLRMNTFFQKANNTANVSLFINISRAQNLILNELNAAWNEYITKDLPYYQSFELAAFQFSYLDGSYFTNYTFSQPEQRKPEVLKANPESGTRFTSPLVSKPFLVRTHAHKSFDIIVQDSSHLIYYLDKSQNQLWAQNVDSGIISEVFPVDYYKNGKIQYAFATSFAVHIWDRSGASIPGYPKSLSDDVQIAQFNVIDYDLSRNYRFAISDTKGEIFLTDKDLNALEGWNPKKLSRSSLTPLNHQRIGRRDVMFSIQSDGKIHFMNRRGQPLKGYPFDTRQSLNKNYFLSISNGLSNSTISVLSTGGELTEINLEGDVVKRSQLIKTTQDATFRIVPDRSGKSFLMVRKEGNSYQVLDDTGNFLFQKDHVSTQPVLIQYYRFGAGKDVVIFTDTASQMLYIYDKSGNLLTGRSLKSGHQASLLYTNSKREFRVFTTAGSNLETYSFKQ